MKTKRKQWYNRGLAGLLVASMMVFCMMPVSAAAHIHDYNSMIQQYPMVVFYDAGSHTIATYQRWQCNCGDIKGKEINRRTDSHDIVYTDYGYDDKGIHHYNVHCTVCSFNQTM